MTDIEQKALALLNDVRTERGFAPVAEVYGSVLLGEALCRAIEQHEAFRQEVSEAVAEYFDCQQNGSRSMFEVAEMRLHSFIIPAPKPDPLLAAMNEVIKTADVVQANADQLRAALEARGFEIREKNDD